MSAKRKKWRVILGVAAGVLVICAIAWIALVNRSEEYAREKLPGLSQKATDTLYRAQVKDVDIGPDLRDITLTDFKISPDARHWAKLTRDLDLPPVRFAVRIPKLHIRGLSVAAYLKNKELVADRLRIVNPIIRVTRVASTPQPKSDQPPPKIERIRIGYIILENPDVQYTDESGGERKTYAAKGGRIALQDWRFELNGAPDTSRLLYAAHTALTLRAITLPDPKGLYNYTIGTIAYDQTGSVLRIENARVIPRLSREAFYRRVGFQKEIYNVHFPLTRLTGVDWRSIQRGSAFIAQGGEIRDGNVSIFMDRVPPPNLQSKDGKFPHQLLMGLGLPVYVPRLDVVNGAFAYAERNQKTVQTGTVRMTAVGGAVENITNMPARIRRDAVCRVDLKGVFKGSTVDATFRFPLDKTETGLFSVDGGMTGMDGARLNDITKPLALADISSLDIRDIRFHLDGSDAGAQGRFTMRYDNLDVDLLEKEEGGGLGEKHVTSWLADKLLLYGANPQPRKDVRRAQPEVERDNTKSFFNVIWKALFTGALQTVGRGKLVENAVNRKARKTEEARKDEVREKRR